jgi:hypothetical protein
MDESAIGRQCSAGILAGCPESVLALGSAGMDACRTAAGTAALRSPRAEVGDCPFLTNQPPWRLLQWCRNCSAWADRERRPCESPGSDAARERSDSSSRALAARPGGVGVRHSHHGMSPGTRKACTHREACGLGRRVGSLECRAPSRSNPTAAPPIPANKRRAVSWRAA